MVTEEQLQTIEKVVNRIYHKYIFGYFDGDDIKQQAIIIGLEAVENNWDGIRPLENFLSVHIANRLENFKRDQYYRPNVDENNLKRSKTNNTKRCLMEPGELFDSDLAKDENFINDMSLRESLNTLLKIMPKDIRSDFQRLVDGASISKARKNKVFDFVREHLHDY